MTNPFVDLVALQNAANVKATKDAEWAVGSYAFYRKCWEEAAEMVVHLNDNWWKNTPFNLLQVQMEVVDILHFLLSETIMYFSHCGASEAQALERTAGAFLDASDDFDATVQPSILTAAAPARGGAPYQAFLFMAVEPFIKAVLNYSDNLYIDEDTVLTRDQVDDLEMLTVHQLFFKLAHHAGLSSKELVFWYIAKNTLNNFRQDNGYKTGDYVKIWSGREDNEYLAEMVDLSDETIEVLPGLIRSRLEGLYQEHTGIEPQLASKG